MFIVKSIDTLVEIWGNFTFNIQIYRDFNIVNK
jgi:hypothetical protein